MLPRGVQHMRASGSFGRFILFVRPPASETQKTWCNPNLSQVDLRSIGTSLSSTCGWMCPLCFQEQTLKTNCFCSDQAPQLLTGFLLGKKCTENQVLTSKALEEIAGKLGRKERTSVPIAVTA